MDKQENRQEKEQVQEQRNEQELSTDGGESQKPDWMAEELASLEQVIPATVNEDSKSVGEAKSLKAKKKLSIAFIVAAVLLYGFATFMAFQGLPHIEGVASVVGYHVGALIGVALGLLLLSKMAWKKFLKQQPGMRLLTYATLLLIFALAVLVLDLGDYKYRSAFMSDFESLTQATGEPYTVNNRARYGRYTVFADTIHEFIASEAELSTRFEQEVANLGLDEVFAEGDFMNAGTLKLAREKLQKEVQLYEEFMSDYHQAGDDFVNRFKELRAPQNVEHMFDLLVKAIESNVAKNVELLSYDRELSIEWDKFMAFLETRVGQFTLVNGEFNFTTEEDWKVSAEFRATLDRIYQASYEAAAAHQD